MGKSRNNSDKKWLQEKDPTKREEIKTRFFSPHYLDLACQMKILIFGKIRIDSIFESTHPTWFKLAPGNASTSAKKDWPILNHTKSKLEPGSCLSNNHEKKIAMMPKWLAFTFAIIFKISRGLDLIAGL